MNPVASLRSGRISLTAYSVAAGSSVGLLALVLWQNREPIHEVLGRQLDLRLFTLAFLITQVSIFITFLRWHILVRVIDPTIALRSSILLGLIGYFFNLVIPGSVGGDVIKAAYLARNRTQKAALIASMA